MYVQLSYKKFSFSLLLALEQGRCGQWGDRQQRGSKITKERGWKVQSQVHIGKFG